MSHTIGYRNAKVLAPYLVSSLIACSTAAAWACPCSEIPKPPAKDPSVAPEKGIAFTHTEEYTREFAQAVMSAQAACEKHIGEPNVAIVSDIDETFLDNRDFQNKEVNAGQWPKFEDWAAASRAPLLPPTAEFLSWAREHGFAIFLITGRKEHLRRATIENLVKDHIAYDGLYMRPDDNSQRAEDMKTTYREQIEKSGFKIIVSIGDQLSDLYGGHAEDCEKLPNKMYYIP